MIKINEQKASDFFNLYFTNKDSTAPLQEMCEVLNLTIKDDSEAVFQLLKDQLGFDSVLQENIMVFPWRVSKDGYFLLKNYALAKQECLSTFQKLYIAGYIRPNKDKAHEIN